MSDVVSLDDVAGAAVAIVSCRLHARLTGSDDPAVFDYALRITFDSDGLIATIDLYENAGAASPAGRARSAPGEGAVRPR